MEFGFTFTLKPDRDAGRIVALTRQAEAAGFTYGWLFDNDVQFMDVYPLLFNVYRMSGDEEAQLEAYRTSIIPVVRAV